MDALARLLLTYLVHSTVLLGGAWIAGRVLGERRLALQEALLRAALLGGFATAALQVSLGFEPLGGVLRLPSAVPAEGAGSRAAAVGPPSLPAHAHAEAPTGAPAPARPVRPRPMGFVIVPAEPTWAERASAMAWRLGATRWREGLALAWLSLAAFALARLAVASRRLERLLRDRQALPGGALAPQVAAVGDALGLPAPLRISAAPRLSVPLATGVLRPEVCLPKRAVVELGPDEQVALCAHELAHVRRRDPAWILAARLAESVAPLQPLNAWARRRLQDVAECLSDDLAVSVSARPLGLARSLVDVASWTLDEPALLPAAAAGALAARSRLGHRVERLMDPVRRLERPRRLLLPAAAAVVLATALVTPVVSGSARDPEPAPAPVIQSPAAAPEAARPAPVPRARAEAQARPAPEERAAAEEARRKTEERLEEIGRRIEERAKLHDGEIRTLEKELQARLGRFHPDDADVQRLASEIDRAAQELTTATLAALEPPADRRAQSEATREAARRMAELQREMRDKAGATRVPAEEMRALQERLRAVTDQVRPTEEEREELRRLSRELARQSMPDLSELSRRLRDDARRQALESRHASERAREAMRRATEELRRAAEEMRMAVDEVRQESLGARPRPEPEAKPGVPRP
jgi:beta-lactamase regulating signal transducer with metallopeptidase domain